MSSSMVVTVLAGDSRASALQGVPWSVEAVVSPGLITVFVLLTRIVSGVLDLSLPNISVLGDNRAGEVTDRFKCGRDHVVVSACLVMWLGVRAAAGNNENPPVALVADGEVARRGRARRGDKVLVSGVSILSIWFISSKEIGLSRSSFLLRLARSFECGGISFRSANMTLYLSILMSGITRSSLGLDGSLLAASSCLMAVFSASAIASSSLATSRRAWANLASIDRRGLSLGGGVGDLLAGSSTASLIGFLPRVTISDSNESFSMRSL